MNELIPIGQGSIGGEKVNTVNARDLQCGLGSKADYSTWFKTQSERARLKEGKDFVVVESLLHKDVEQTRRGGHNRIDYFLTIEAAKHIAMMSGTEKGYEVRDYFIECERRANNPALSLSRLDLFRMGLEAEERAITPTPADTGPSSSEEAGHGQGVSRIGQSPRSGRLDSPPTFEPGSPAGGFPARQA